MERPWLSRLGLAWQALEQLVLVPAELRQALELRQAGAFLPAEENHREHQVPGMQGLYSVRLGPDSGRQLLKRAYRWGCQPVL